VVLDGVFIELNDGVRFHEATHLSADDAAALAPVLQRRILRLFQRRGLLDEHTVDDMLTWQGTGGFSVDAAVRIHGSDRAGRERLIRYCARPPFALARLRIEPEPGARHRPAGAGDAEPLEATSAPRTSDPRGVRRVFYQPARPTPDGRTLLALSPLEFLKTLSRLEADGTRLVFTPTQPLQPVTTYTIHLGGGMTDTRGRHVDLETHGAHMGGKGP
jgi:hypothetical protein